MLEFVGKSLLIQVVTSQLTIPFKGEFFSSYGFLNPLPARGRGRFCPPLIFFADS